MKTLKKQIPAVLAAIVIFLGVTLFHSCRKNDFSNGNNNPFKSKSINGPKTLLTLPHTISQGLIAYWPLARTAYDLSGNGNSGTIHSLTLTTDRFSHANGAYFFNGTSSYISVPQNTILNLNNTDFTVNAWIDLSSYSSSYGSAIINKHLAGNNNGWAYSITGDSATRKYVQAFGPGGTSINGYGIDTVNLNHWHMVSSIYNVTTHTLKFYLDNVLDDSIAGILSPSALDSTMLYMGRDNPGSSANGYFFHGAMNDIRIYNRQVTLSELTTLFTATTAPTSGLQAWWPLTKTPNDLSVNAHNGTNSGPYPGTDRFGNTIGAYHFNGTSAYISVDSTGLKLNNTDFTVNAWVKLVAYNTSYGSAIMNRHLSGNNNGWAWSITGDTATTQHVQFFGPGGTANNSYGSTVIPLNSWHMVTCTYKLSTQTISFYVDGVFDTSVTGIASPNAYTETQLYIGRDNPSSSANGYFFNGLMNDIRIYNRVITSTDISQLLNALD